MVIVSVFCFFTTHSEAFGGPKTVGQISKCQSVATANMHWDRTYTQVQ